MNGYFKIQCAAIILIAAGYGWAGGHYIPANSTIFAYVFQLVVLATLLLLAITFLSLPENKRYSPNWAKKGLTIFSIASFIINVANIIHGAFNSDPSSFGSHNSFADLVPIVFLIIGSGLWVITVFKKKSINLSGQ
ncbi:MAG TPA: hypothetical protein VK890_10790 [Bacteroidia bacterium]|jgi:hypothetical protein|nr:hypothetical protein [Bacteroidia bacterium]